MKEKEKRNLKNKIIKYIYDAILNNEYKQNEQIKEVHLANKLEVSRIPTREALLELVSLGILEHIERRGVFVKEVTGTDILNTYQAQGLIEGFLATSFALFATQEDMDELDKLLVKMCDKANDSKAIAVIGKEFHRYCLKYATNTILLDELEKINKKTLLMFTKNLGHIYNTIDEIEEEHKRIVDALKSRDKVQIENVIKTHYFEAGTKIVLFNN
jgi:DNA-binding GntR family transcriptional regulator